MSHQSAVWLHMAGGDLWDLSALDQLVEKNNVSRLGLAMVVEESLLQNVQSSYILMHWTLNKQVVCVENLLYKKVWYSIDWRCFAELCTSEGYRLQTCPTMEIPARFRPLQAEAQQWPWKVTSLHSLHRPCEFYPASFKNCLANSSPGSALQSWAFGYSKIFPIATPQLCGAAMPGRMPLGQQHISNGLMIFVWVSSWGA